MTNNDKDKTVGNVVGIDRTKILPGPNVFKIILAGLSTGLISTAVFNPFDRALYLMVSQKKSLFDKSLWKHPYNGVSQAIYGRIISYGINFTFYDIFKQKLQMNSFTAGLLTGTFVGFMANPVSVVKMHNWNKRLSNHSFLKLSKDLSSMYGKTVFLRGLHLTILRDSIFSLIYYSNQTDNAYNNIAFGTLATVSASPINYVRNCVFFDFNRKQKVIIKETLKTMKTDIVTGRYYDLVFSKFNCGWGTLRVGIGMAFSKWMYDNMVRIQTY